MVLAFFTVAGRHGLLALVQMDAKVAELTGQNSNLESEIVEMKNQIYAVQHSDFALEKHAREELGLSKPGEIVYIFSRPLRKEENKQ
jgi:cell division protein FtsB